MNRTLRVLSSWTKYILTEEDWFPTVEGKIRVLVRFYEDGAAEVLAFGGDDFMLAKRNMTHVAAEYLFAMLYDHSSQAKMKQLGMSPE